MGTAATTPLTPRTQASRKCSVLRSPLGRFCKDVKSTVLHQNNRFFICAQSTLLYLKASRHNRKMYYSRDLCVQGRKAPKKPMRKLLQQIATIATTKIYVLFMCLIYIVEFNASMMNKNALLQLYGCPEMKCGPWNPWGHDLSVVKGAMKCSSSGVQNYHIKGKEMLTKMPICETNLRYNTSW